MPVQFQKCLHTAYVAALRTVDLAQVLQATGFTRAAPPILALRGQASAKPKVVRIRVPKTCPH